MFKFYVIFVIRPLLPTQDDYWPTKNCQCPELAGKQNSARDRL